MVERSAIASGDRRIGVIVATAALLAVLACAAPSSALVITGYETFEEGEPNPNTNLINNTAPPDDRGWSNLADNRQGVYLGDHWFLSARHVTGAGTIEIGGGTFAPIPGSTRVLTNTGSLDNESDLFLYRVGVDATSGMSPEELDPSIRQITIADSLPSTGTTLTMFGKGNTRRLNSDNTDDGRYFFDSSGSIVPSPVSGGFSGYLTANNSTGDWQWGENRRSGGTLTLSAGTFVNDTRGFRVRFDSSAGDNEAQGAAGDSGGPVFWEDDGEYVLAGLMHVIFSAGGNGTSATLFSAFNAQTGISDLSNSGYRSQLASIRGESAYSAIGDLDLDGLVTGEIIDGVATGDLGILVQNWLNEEATADIHSWTKGDIDQDGVTDLTDLVLMREALGGTISMSSLAALVGPAAVPEPAAALLVATGLLGFRPRRR